MCPSNSKLSPNCKSTSCIKNKNGKRKRKRSLFKTSKNDEDDTDDFYYIRKKSIKHSQVDINNAVLTAPNGYMMTRNKLKKQLTSIDNSELVETTVIEDKCLKIDNIKSKTEKVFTSEISSPCPGKQLDTYYKKRIPSLFESDSDPEIDNFQIKDSIKSEVEEISTCISYPDDRLYPAFDKNVDMKTYFNKKMYPINNKSNVQSFEKIHEEPSSLNDRVKTAHDSNQSKIISQNYSQTSKSLKATAFEKIHEEPSSLNDRVKTAHDSNQSKIISQNYSQTSKSLKATAFEKIHEEPSSLNDRVKTAHDSNQSKIISQNYSQTSKSLKATGPEIRVQINSEGDEIIIVTESLIRQLKNELEITKKKSQDSNNSTTISEEIIDLTDKQTFEGDNSSPDLSIENHHNAEKNITCHLSLDQIEPNQYSHTVIKDEIKNKPKYYNCKGRYNCLLKNDNLSINESHSNKNDLNSKCYCKNFRSFNKDVNKIFTSKIKHFAFNNNAKKLRDKILRKKHLEANILNMLITKEHKNIIQSSKHIPFFNSISINKNYEKCIDLKENHHIKPEHTKTNAVGKINTNTTRILKVDDSSKDERTIDCLSSAASIKNFITDVKFCENNLINPKNKQSSEINLIKVSNTILPKKNSFDDHMSFEMYNEFNKIKSLNKSISSNPTTKENNSVSLQKPNGESILKSEINNHNIQKQTINPSIKTQTSNSLQKSTIPGIIDSEKETNITLLIEPPQYKNLFDTSNTISSKAYQICPMLPHISENNNNKPLNNLFDLPVDDITFSLNNKSSDDDGIRTLIVSNSILPKKNSLDDCMSFEMCNEFYKIKSLSKSIVSKNESLPNHIQNILKEMYVDELFVTTCQHMVDSYSECRKIPSNVKLICDIINKNGPMLSHISENNEPVNNLFDLPVNDCFLIK